MDSLISNKVKTILYLLPTRDWGTTERFLFKDIGISKKHGLNVLLCTYEDSILALMARELEITLIPYRDHFVNRFFKYHKHFSLKNILQKYSIDIVHCYDFSLLFSLSFQLSRKQLISLIFTQDHSIDKPLQRFWYRPLISRIDSLILLNKELKQDAIGNLGLPLKRIEYFGMGINLIPPNEEEKIAFNFDLYKDYFLAGTYVAPESYDFEMYTPLLYALKVLNEKNTNNAKNKLVFVSTKEFSKMQLLPDLLVFIEENGLKESVVFVTAKHVSLVINFFDIWISNTNKELVEDYAVSALIHEVPVIFPRNFCTKEILLEYEGVGETYKLFDARELRDKWEKMFMAIGLYREKTKLYKFFIEREHNYKLYKMELLSLYSKTIQRRSRLFLRK